jgi:hypothetical protein
MPARFHAVVGLAVALLAASPVLVQCESLADLAKREKERREALHAERQQETSTFTNEDLPAPTPTPEGTDATAAPEENADNRAPARATGRSRQSRGPRSRRRRSAETDNETDLDRERKERKRADALWCQRIEGAKRAVTQLEAALAQAAESAHATAYGASRYESAARARKVKEEHRQALRRIESTKRRLEEARQRLDDLQEEARRAGAPPSCIY